VFAIVLFPFSDFVRLNVIVWRVLFSCSVYVLFALVCVQFSLFVQRWLILQCKFKYVYDAIVPVWYLFVSCLFCIYCTCVACFWVVTLCSQLLCLCLRFCCVRVVALVCLCHLQSCVVFSSHLFGFSCYLFVFVLSVCLLLHLFINVFLYLVLYANTCHVLCFVYRCTCHCFCLFVLLIFLFCVITCFVCFCAARGARTLFQKPYGVCRSRLKGLPNLCICPQCAWKPWSVGFKEQRKSYEAINVTRFMLDWQLHGFRHMKL